MAKRSRPGPRKGKIFTTPQGERRLRFEDVSQQPNADEVHLSLYQILNGDPNVLPTNVKAGAIVKVNALNLKGLSLIELHFGGIEQLPTNPKASEIQKLAWILVNQDRDEKEELTQDQVGRMLPADKLYLINEVLKALIAPLPGSPLPPAKTAGDRGGSGLSGTSPQSSASSILSKSGGSGSTTS